MEPLRAPLLFIAFNRPEKTQKVWDQIKKAKPSKLYISIDGPRKDLPSDYDKIKRVREIVQNVDWKCDVKYLIHNYNLGCTLAGKTAFDWVFSQESEMIELEDDVIPTQSFFWFMQQLLDKYKNDKRIAYICAENYGHKSGEATYFFSKYGGSWGWATWKRVYDLYEYKLDSLEDTVNNEKFKKTFSSNFQYEYWKRRFFEWKYIGGNTYDLQIIYLVHKHDMCYIVPNKNLVTNIGWDADASNTILNESNKIQAKKFGNIPSYEIDEIIHPQSVTIDPQIDIKWFKYHFLKKSELEYRLRWILSPYKQKFLKLLSNYTNK
jgi:hypothetical protein